MAEEQKILDQTTVNSCPDNKYEESKKMGIKIGSHFIVSKQDLQLQEFMIKKEIHPS